MNTPVLEPAAQAFVEATASPPYLFDLGPVEGRKVVDEVQTPEIAVPGTSRQSLDEPAITIFRPDGVTGPLPVILYIHGAGWVFGNDHTHDRLARELAAGVGAAVVFANYSLSPEARYPTAIGENHAVARWVVRHGAEHGLDASRIAVAGDSVGANMAAALTLTAKQHGDVPLLGQVLFYPVTDAAFDTGSYHQFAEGYFLRRDAMQWFWDQYTTDKTPRLWSNCGDQHGPASRHPHGHCSGAWLSRTEVATVTTCLAPARDMDILVSRMDLASRNAANSGYRADVARCRNCRGERPFQVRNAR